ncbi:hypothetical protein GCM10007880_64500 [Mesorhizobium amorphae]|nr:hypothetical protein GCM10007880_64500 [Mesorhizobium amorphae]
MSRPMARSFYRVQLPWQWQDREASLEPHFACLDQRNQSLFLDVPFKSLSGKLARVWHGFCAQGGSRVRPERRDGRSRVGWKPPDPVRERKNASFTSPQRESRAS